MAVSTFGDPTAGRYWLAVKAVGSASSEIPVGALVKMGMLEGTGLRSARLTGGD